MPPLFSSCCGTQKSGANGNEGWVGPLALFLDMHPRRRRRRRATLKSGFAQTIGLTLKELDDFPKERSPPLKQVNDPPPYFLQPGTLIFYCLLKSRSPIRMPPFCRPVAKCHAIESLLLPFPFADRGPVLFLVQQWVSPHRACCLGITLRRSLSLSFSSSEMPIIFAPLFFFPYSSPFYVPPSLFFFAFSLLLRPSLATLNKRLPPPPTLRAPPPSSSFSYMEGGKRNAKKEMEKTCSLYTDVDVRHITTTKKYKSNLAILSYPLLGG